MGFVLRPALVDSFEEQLLVLLHQPNERLVFRFLVPPRPQHHFGEHRRKINPFWRELVNELSPVRGIAVGSDDSIGLEPAQPVGQYVRRDSFVGPQEFLERPRTEQHHVPDDQQRPSVAQHLHRCI